jgi:hypothetical protein
MTTAIEYNRTRDYTIAQTMQIQAVCCGAEPDGAWGPETLGAVEIWQEASGLAVDGKVGPRTHAAILSAWDEMTDPPEVGVWWDIGARWTLDRREELADDIVAAGIGTVAG